MGLRPSWSPQPLTSTPHKTHNIQHTANCCWQRGRELNPLQQGYEPRPVTELSPQFKSPLVHLIQRAVYPLFTDELSRSLSRREAGIKVSLLLIVYILWHPASTVRKHFFQNAIASVVFLIFHSIIILCQVSQQIRKKPHVSLEAPEALLLSQGLSLSS